MLSETCGLLSVCLVFFVIKCAQQIRFKLKFKFMERFNLTSHVEKVFERECLSRVRVEDVENLNF